MDDPIKTALEVGTLTVSAAVLFHQRAMDKAARKRDKKVAKALKKQAKKSEEIRAAANAVKEKVLAAHAAGMADEKAKTR